MSSPRSIAQGIVNTLRDGGHIAYFAGGCVRDALLGVEPKDFDVVTDAPPARIAELFERTNQVGAAFGVVLVRIGSVVTEVATFREDGAYSDRRRPDRVVFATAVEDAQRRDFTINALFLDPLKIDPRAGEDGVIDFVDGRADLEAGLIRAVGVAHDRLAEDDLRALRAVRFACRLGFAVEASTADAIRAHAGELAGVSRERIGDELRRMLGHPSRARAVAMLGDLGIAGAVFGEGTAVGALPVLGGLAGSAGFVEALAALAVDLGLDPADASGRAGVLTGWRQALCLSNEERGELAEALRDLGVLRSGWGGLGVAAQKRLVVRPSCDVARRVLASWDAEGAEAVAGRVAELEAIGPGLSAEPFVDGDRLIELGFEPGPRFKRVLDGVYDAQLEGRVGDSVSAEALARELWSGSGVE